MVEVEVWAAFYRGIETFRWAMVGGESKCWSNGGFDEVKIHHEVCVCIGIRNTKRCTCAIFGTPKCFEYACM